MSIVLDGTVGITTPNVSTDTSTLGPLTQALNLGSTGQIVFPATQNASANANTLDDYEEGTWTPGLQFGGSSSGVSFFVQDGTYTKIGRFVYCQVILALSNNGSGSGNAQITNLPFTVGNVLPNTSLESGGLMTFFSNSGTSVSGFTIIPEESSTVALIVALPASGTTSAVATESYITDSFDCRLFFSYNT